MTRLLQWVLLGYALFMPISIAAAEPLALLSVVLWLWLVWRGEIRAGPPSPYRWPLAIFLAVAFLASLLGARPGVSLPKLDRFLLLGVILVIPSVCTKADDAVKLIKCFVAGAVAKGIYDLVRIPSAVLGGVSVFQTGNMREPQIYAVALCFVVAALIYGARIVRDKPLLLALITTAAGLVLHFKRGAWLAFILAACLMALLAGRRRVMGIILLCAACLLALPVVRDRIGMSKNELSVTMKGRYPIWTHAAPKLIKKYPFGMGWKAPRYEDLRAETRYVQKKLNHLHDNALEVTLELGWLGLLAWLYWMGFSLVFMARNYMRARGQGQQGAAVCLGVLGGFVALMLNGLVEYNFGDAEIFMVLCFLMALSVLASRQPDSSLA